jgi:predicted transcriptional regulator
MAKAVKSIYTIWKNFKDVREGTGLSAFECALYHELVMICNSRMWQDGFKVGNVELIRALNISESSLKRSRKMLIDAGLIRYEPSLTRGEFGSYSITYKKEVSQNPENSSKGLTQTPKKKNRGSHRPPKVDLGIHTGLLSNILGFTQSPLAPAKPLPVKFSGFLILSNTYNNTNNNTLFPDADASGVIEKVTFSDEKPPAKRNTKAAHEAYKPMVDFWLKDMHPDWSFSQIDGVKMKSIIGKIEHRIRGDAGQADPVLVLETFKVVCKHLPDFYKTKPLQVIDSHFDSIADEIKIKIDGKTGQQQQFSTRAAAAYNDAAAKYGRRAQSKTG